MRKSTANIITANVTVEVESKESKNKRKQITWMASKATTNQEYCNGNDVKDITFELKFKVKLSCI